MARNLAFCGPTLCLPLMERARIAVEKSHGLRTGNTTYQSNAVNRIPTNQIIAKLCEGKAGDQAVLFGAAQILIQAVGEAIRLKELYESGGHKDFEGLESLFRTRPRKSGAEALAIGNEPIWSFRSTAISAWKDLTDKIQEVLKVAGRRILMSSIQARAGEKKINLDAAQDELYAERDRDVMSSLNAVITHFTSLIQLNVTQDQGESIRPGVPYDTIFLVKNTDKFPAPKLNGGTEHLVKVCNHDGTSYEAAMSKPTETQLKGAVPYPHWLNLGKITRTPHSTAYGTREQISGTKIEAIEFIDNPAS